MSHSTGWSYIAIVAFVTANASNARALQLDWQAPVGCPTSAAVRRDITRLAGSSEGDALIARAIVTATTNGRFRVTIDLTGSATGHRTLTGDTCLQIARASSLIIALAANPEAALELHADETIDSDGNVAATAATAPAAAAPAAAAPAQPSPPEQQPTAVPVKPPSISPRPSSTAAQRMSAAPDEPPGESAQPSRPARRWTLMALAGHEWGTLPTPTNWLGIEGKFRASRFPLSAALGTLITQRTSAEYVDIDVGARFQSAAAQARLCLEPNRSGWYVEACGGAQVSLVRANGYVRHDRLARNGLSEVEAFSTYRWIPGPLMALALGYEIAGALSLKAGAALVIPTARWQFVIENGGTLYESAKVLTLLYFGIGGCFD